MRHIILICLILTDSCFTNVMSPTSAAAVTSARSTGVCVCVTAVGKTGARSTGSGSGLSTCRCTPDQFEAVLKSVERQIDLQFGSRSDAEVIDYEVLSAAIRANNAREEVERDDERLLISGPMVVEAESSTFVYYDYTNGLLATVEEAGRVKTIVDHEAGVQYVISPEGACRRAAIEHRMKRMCLPDGAVLTAKFSLGFDQPVSLWKFDGPNNSSLRTVVERRRCIPVLEETFSVSDGYASLTSTVYINVRLGIRDKGIFSPPPSCLINTDARDYPVNTAPSDGIKQD